MAKIEENWLAKYTALRELTEEQERLLDELMGLRTHEHTGGLNKKLIN